MDKTRASEEKIKYYMSHFYARCPVAEIIADNELTFNEIILKRLSTTCNMNSGRGESREKNWDIRIKKFYKTPCPVAEVIADDEIILKRLQ